MARLLIVLGALNAFFATALGAFAHHALKGRLPESLLAAFSIGTTYHMWHGLALVLVGLWGMVGEDPPYLRATGILFQLGILLFCGSLYLLALTGVKILGVVTPIGGGCFLAGWFLFARSARGHS